jgi:hypothetical protein
MTGRRKRATAHFSLSLLSRLVLIRTLTSPFIPFTCLASPRPVDGRPVSPRKSQAKVFHQSVSPPSEVLFLSVAGCCWLFFLHKTKSISSTGFLILHGERKRRRRRRKTMRRRRGNNKSKSKNNNTNWRNSFTHPQFVWLMPFSFSSSSRRGYVGAVHGYLRIFPGGRRRGRREQ